MTEAERLAKIIELLGHFGGFWDQPWHMQWVVDQIARLAAGTEADYEAFVLQFNEPGYDPWNKGIAP